MVPPVCWGPNIETDRGRWQGQISPPAEERLIALSSGLLFTCALWEDGTPVCWGKGYDTPEPQRIEYKDVLDQRFVSITAGWDYNWALRPDGKTLCWGHNRDADPNWRDYGREWPPEGEQFESMSTGSSHTRGLRGDGTTACLG